MKNVLLTLLLSASTAAFACRCAPPGPITQSIYDSYDLVATAEVVKVEPADYDVAIYLLINQNFKGAETDTVMVTTGASSAACGLGARVGDVFLLYASAQEGRFYSDSCTRTALLNHPSGARASHVEDDLAFLEKLKE